MLSQWRILDQKVEVKQVGAWNVAGVNRELLLIALSQVNIALMAWGATQNLIHTL